MLTPRELKCSAHLVGQRVLRAATSSGCPWDSTKRLKRMSMATRRERSSRNNRKEREYLG